MREARLTAPLDLNMHIPVHEHPDSNFFIHSSAVPYMFWVTTKKSSLHTGTIIQRKRFSPVHPCYRLH